MHYINLLITLYLGFSESPSQQSSRTGSPTNQMNYDDMEGQFPSPPFPGRWSLDTWYMLHKL